MKILHLEDNREDAALVRELLLDEWPGCEIKVVATGPDFLGELRRPGYEVILSDFNLGSFTGLEALQLTLQHAPEIPFIFLSGTIGEERAIEAVRAGAHDYVLKDRIKRLVTAIQRALRENEEQKKRRDAEEAQRRFVAILENTPDFVGLAGLNGRVFYINHAGQRMIGLAATQDPGMLSLRDLHPPEIGDPVLNDHMAAAMRDGTWSGESTLYSRGGRRIPVSQVIIAHRAADGTTEYFSTIMRDITAAKEAELRIREQADLINKARDAIVVSDLEGRITFWNQGAERIFGWTTAEAVGRRRDELFGTVGGETEAAQRNAAEDDWRSELRLHDKQNRALVVDNRVTVIRNAAGQPTSHLSILTDITAKKQLEEQFLRAQRMESIGLLAAGIAHDLNNVLAPILMGAPILRDRVTEPGDIKLLTALEKSAERGAGLVRQILGFAQGVGGAPQLIQAKHLIRDLSNVIRETFPKAIRFEEQIASDLWTIRANPTQVHQILLNLCVNARDAMPAQGGTLRLKAENCTLDELAALALDGARPGAWVVLQVEDTGSGIPPEVLAHIWEPFFTTKEAGKGTGLGLSTVRGIVESHSGFITLQTEAGRGTTIRVYLPAAEGQSTGNTASTVHPFSARGNGELILVVDDEPNVRDITSAILSRHGYRVLVASDGTEAVALFAPRSNEIPLVITDVNMPDLDGAAVANVVRRINPAVKILAVSGMEAGARQATQAHPFANAFLLKPFKIETLLASVQQLLAAETPPAK